MALIKCPECDGQRSTTASLCPHCGHTDASARRPLWNPEPVHIKSSRMGFDWAKLAVAVAILGVSAGAAYFIFGNGASSRAEALCEQSVLDRLKSPSTAVFPDFSAVSLEGDAYQVDAYVDSQNGFGAVSRSRFQCLVNCSGGDCVLVNLAFHK